MSDQTTQLYLAALRLPEAERGELAARLLESLDPGADADAEAAWGEEIQQRLAELDSSAHSPVPWAVARGMIVEDADESCDG